MSKTENYKVNIDETNLMIRRNMIIPTVLLAHINILEPDTASGIEAINKCTNRHTWQNIGGHFSQ